MAGLLFAFMHLSDALSPLSIKCKKPLRPQGLLTIILHFALTQSDQRVVDRLLDAVGKCRSARAQHGHVGVGMR